MSSSKVSLHKNPKTSNKKQERPFSDFTQLDLLNWEFNIRGTKKKLRDIIRVMLSKDEVELLEPQSQNEKKFQQIVLSAINKQRKRKKRPLIKTVELIKSDAQINETQAAINAKKFAADNRSTNIRNATKQQKPVKEEAEIINETFKLKIENSIKLCPSNKSQGKIIQQEIQSVDNTIKLSLNKKSSMKNLNAQIERTDQNPKKYRKRTHTKTPTKDDEANVQLPKLKKSSRNAYTAGVEPNGVVLYLKDEAELQTETATKTIKRNDAVTETVAKNAVESKDKNARYEISIFDLKSKEKYISDWNDNEHQFLLKNQYSSIYYILKHNLPTDVTIKVNNSRFKCHLAILQTYSTFFLKYKNQKVIELNSKEVDTQAFKIIHDFMINKQPKLGRNYLMEVFRAASYLRIKSIVDYCWRFFDHPFFCLEDNAFVVYLDSQISNFKYHKIFRDQMFKKISKFFLCLVSTKEFLNFNINELRQLLLSDEIAVNTEMEIFYSAVRWINYDYKSRYRHTLMIMSCVRFNLVPSEILLDLGKTNELEVQYIISQKKVAKLIQEGITYGTALEYYSKDYETLQRALRKYNLKKPTNRQWVFDMECMHHHKVDCVNLHKVDYRRFLNYLYNMRNLGMDHWKKYKKCDEISTTLECCPYQNIESFA